jgi:hypothetical protein
MTPTKSSDFWRHRFSWVGVKGPFMVISSRRRETCSAWNSRFYSFLSSLRFVRNDRAALFGHLLSTITRYRGRPHHHVGWARAFACPPKCPHGKKRWATLRFCPPYEGSPVVVLERVQKVLLNHIASFRHVFTVNPGLSALSGPRLPPR